MPEIEKIEDRAILGIKHNPSIWIAEGANRFSTAWKNREIKWSQLLKRLQTPTRTQETQAEYLKMTKNQQDNIKDVGGFVGGTLNDGHRKSDTVGKRYLLTFDLDFAPQDFCDRMELSADYAWAIYSTHKHKPEQPRLRLIVPLDRAVDPEEYEAIGRKVAEDIGLEFMDSTTFQPARLMYWPSCSRGAEYVFKYNDDKLLKADEWLGKYPNWKDVTLWPVCPDEIRVQKRRKDKQQDPTTKTGPVGTFCRTYTVPEAIAEYLADVYVKSGDKDDRYTYTAGSTFGGLVIYDDGLFCFSNHSTDPAHGQDLNAFDLVRIHKFGKEDEDLPENTAPSKRPSYHSMVELIRKDRNCIRTYDEERRASALTDFSDDGEDPEQEDTDWRLDLERNKNGSVMPTVENILLIFRMDSNLKGLRYNQLTGFIDITGPLPWTNLKKEWTDADDSALYIYISTNYGVFKRTDIFDALTFSARERTYHPIREYLKQLPEWDGKQRVETLFIDYLGAEDGQYTREATKRWMLAAVSRIMQPGCKFDYIPVLSGPGGIGKSTLVRKLGRDWFSDNLSFEDMRDKTAAEKILGFWINEIGELKGMRKMDVESVKSFISRQEDTYRASYGKHAERHLRSCVFIGTSNATDYLKDITGNRRFWPIECSGIRKRNAWDMKPDEVDQLWAEIMFYYDALGERELEIDASLAQIVSAKQIEALEQDERLGFVQEYLDTDLPENWNQMDLSDRRIWLDDPGENPGVYTRETVSVMEIWAECFRMNPMAKKKTDSDDVARILLQLGWTRKGRTTKRLPIYGTQGIYERGQEPV